MSHISDLEKWFREQLLETAAVIESCGARIYNSVAAPNCQFPYLIYQVIPLDDASGQRGATIQTRVLIDCQIHSELPLPATVDPAVTAFDDKIGGARASSCGSSLIAVRRVKPISRFVKSNVPDQKIIARGSTYKGWISSICADSED